MADASPAVEGKRVELDLLKSFFEKEEHRRNLAELLRNLKLNDKSLQDEMSEMFVRRALADDAFSDDALETSVDLQTQALILSGMNTQGACLVNDSLQRQAFESLLPLALKNQEDGLVNSHVAQALIGYINHTGDTPFFNERADAIVSELVTDKTRDALLQRVADQALSSPLPQEETQALLAKHEITPSRREAANDAEIVPQPEGISSDMEVGRASDEFKYPDAGEFSDNAYREAEKYQLTIDSRAEARDRINALLKEKPGWVERTVVDRLRAKKDQFIEDLNDGALFVKDPLKYPKESLFSETLSEVDETGREVHELVVMRNTPLSMKAIFKKPDAPKEAYEISALRLREQGVKRPYINATFKDKGKCQQFLMQSVEGLLKAGYDIDDIVVAPRIKHLFGPIYEHHMQRGMLSEAPEDLIASPDDPDVAKRHGMEDPDPGPARPSGNEAVHEQIRAIHEPLDAVINMYEGAEEGQSQGIRDLEPEVLAAAMSVAPHIEDEASWQRAVDEGGLNPRSNDFMKRLVGDFKKMIVDVAGKEPNQVGAKSAELVMACESLMTTIYHDDPEGLNYARDAYRNAAERIRQNQPAPDVHEGPAPDVHDGPLPDAHPDAAPGDLGPGPDAGMPGHEQGEQAPQGDAPPFEDIPHDANLDDVNAMLQNASQSEDDVGYYPDFAQEGPPPQGEHFAPPQDEVPPPSEPGAGEQYSPDATAPDAPDSVSVDVDADLADQDMQNEVIAKLPDEPLPDDMWSPMPPETSMPGEQALNGVEQAPDGVNDAPEQTPDTVSQDDVSVVPDELSHDETPGLDALSETEVAPEPDDKVKELDLVTDMDRQLIQRLADLPDEGFSPDDAELFAYAKGIARNGAHQEQIVLCAEQSFDGEDFAKVKRNLRDCLVALDDVMIDIDSYKDNVNITSVWKSCDPALHPVDCKEAISQIIDAPKPDAPSRDNDAHTPAPPKR